MEDPVKFDVYGKVPPSMARDAANFSCAEGTYPSRFEALKAANHSTQHNVHIILLRSVGWLLAQKISKLAPWAREVVFCQEGYEINDKYAYCQKHNLQYGGVRGCHVCSGFFVA